MPAVQRNGGPVPSHSYRPPRADLTRWPESDDHTRLSFSTEVPDPLYAIDNPSVAPMRAPDPLPASTVRRPRAQIESARHVVLRRLAPALKHDMVVNLQAVSMMAEMLNARLERTGPQAADLQASVAKLNRLARDAVVTCLRVSSWIEPGEDDTVVLQAGVLECVDLMSGSLNFRGFRLLSEVPPTEFEVCRGALRTLLAGSLITLADTAGSPAELQVRSQVSAHQAVVTISCVPEGADAPKPLVDPTGPRIEWNDLVALAEAESGELLRTGDQVTIRLPRAVPASPLRMAPM